MSPSETMERLRTLRQTYEAKGRDADALLAKSSPTQDDLRRAEKLFDERDEAGRQIKELQEDLGGTVPGEPFGGRKARGQQQKGGGNPFGVRGSTPAGRTVFDAETLDVLEEAGPGTFGAKAWEAMQSWEYHLGFGRYLRVGSKAMGEFKTLQLGIDEQGGVLAPAEFLNRIIGREPAPTRMRGLVTTLNTGRDRIEVPRLQYSADDKYSTGFRVTRTGERPASATAHRVTDTDLFGHFGIDVHTFMISGDLTLDMVEDSAFPLMSWFSDKFAETVDLLYEDKITNGSGIGEPHGFLSNPGAADRPPLVALGDASNLTINGILDVEYALPEQYDQNARWVFNKTSTAKAMSKLQDTTSGARLFFQSDSNIPSMEPGAFRNLRGYPYAFNHFMPDVGGNNYPIAFGDFRGYYLAQRLGLSVQVVREKYVEENKVAVVGRLRFGGKPIEFWKLRIGKVATSI